MNFSEIISNQLFEDLEHFKPHSFSKPSYYMELEKIINILNQNIGNTWNELKKRKKKLLSIGGEQISADQYPWVLIQKEFDKFPLFMTNKSNFLNVYDN